VVSSLLVALGGAVGAGTRFLVDRWAKQRSRTGLPLGTLVVNVTGCLLLGFLTAASARLPGAAQPLLATGFCGALTTFSTFSHETVQLLLAGRWRTAAGNACGSLAAGVAAALLGAAAATALG
jgi:CrcB protein